MTVLSVEALLEVANKVRIAGGAEPLTTLPKSIKGNSRQCLIARSLNFNCQIKPNDDGVWVMYVSEKKLAKRVAKALKTKKRKRKGKLIPDSVRWEIILPVDLGHSARAFDYGHYAAYAIGAKYYNHYA